MSKANDKKTNAELALEAHKKQVKKANKIENSEIASTLGKTKEITVAKGTDQEYTLTLQYPGTARALEILDLSSNKYDHVAFSLLMQEAIKDVIVSPKITSLSFWDKHKGLSEVAAEVLSFLNEGLDGNL
jgi:hypothetical protein